MIQLNRMRVLLFLCLCMFSVFRCQQSKPISRTVEEGTTVDISCPYPAGYQSCTKSFYKGYYGQRTLLIQAHRDQGNLAILGRYRLFDDVPRRVLTVTISNVTLHDDGTYWCWIDCLFGFDPKVEVQLHVRKALKPPGPQTKTFTPSLSATSTPTRTTAEKHSSDSTAGDQLYVTLAVLAALLLVATGLAVLLRRCYRTTSPESSPTTLPPTGRECKDNRVYEEIVDRDMELSVTSPGTDWRAPGLTSTLQSPYAVITYCSGPDSPNTHSTHTQEDHSGSTTNPIYDSCMSLTQCQHSGSATATNQYVEKVNDIYTIDG